MSQIWSDGGGCAGWLDVELAALEGWAAVGVVPGEAVATIRERALVPTPERVAEIERETNHDVAAFVDVVSDGIGDEGRWLHYGLTSSDVLDTALSLAVRRPASSCCGARPGLRDALVFQGRGAPRHRLHRAHPRRPRRADHVRPQAGAGSSPSSATASGSSARSRVCASASSPARSARTRISPEVEQDVCEQARACEPATISTQILQRDRHAEFLAALALVAASLERSAQEIRHLQRTEVREVEEPFGAGQKGSSAMPHKRNPIIAERLCGLARVLRGYALVGLENVALWHERDISHSSAERVVLPDATIALDYMLEPFHAARRGDRRCDDDRMRENLDADPRRSTSASGCSSHSSSPGSPATTPTGSCSATRCGRGTRASTSAGCVDADGEIAGRVDLDAVFDPASVHRPRRGRLRPVACARDDAAGGRSRLS